MKIFYSSVFHPHEARQQLGCLLFLLDESAPPYKATPKMGCWNQLRKMRRVTFCLTIFSSPDNKHNITLSSNYDLRMLRNIFLYVLIVLIIQMMDHEKKGPELSFFFFSSILSLISRAKSTFFFLSKISTAQGLGVHLNL